MSKSNDELRRVFLDADEVEWIKNAVAGNVQREDPAAGRLRVKLRERELDEAGDFAKARRHVWSIEAVYEDCTTQSGLHSKCWEALDQAARELVRFCATRLRRPDPFTSV